MSDGHKTTSIRRPDDVTRAATRSAPRPGARAGDHTRLAEFTRPIPRDKQLVKGRGNRTVLWLGGLVISAALVSTLFVLPVKAWLRQRDDLAQRQHELTVLNETNAELTAEINRLKTPEGLKQAAREEVGMVEPGEIRVTALAPPAAPLALPAGFPYDAISQIVAVRVTEAAATAQP